MGKYLIDNNVISNYFSGLLPDKGMSFIAEVIDQTPVISVITEIEALSWINPDTSKEKIIREFIKDARVLELSPAVVNKCVEIRRSKRIKLPDAIISATAIVHKLTLITSDSDFQNIKELNILDPKRM
jgi:predicted nucleic acid-binding protein